MPERPDDEIGKLKMEPDRPKRSRDFSARAAMIVVGPEGELSAVRQCVPAGVSRATMYVCGATPWKRTRPVCGSVARSTRGKPDLVDMAGRPGVTTFESKGEK